MTTFTQRISGVIRKMNFYDIEVEDINNNKFKMEKFKGNVLLIVNVASECGYTPQYEDLQLLYEDMNDDHFFILGFPCNQFGAQEPGTNDEIMNFCSTKYHVTFPMFSKIDVKGPNKAPIYQYLTKDHPEPKWNFHKYLVSKTGEVIESLPSDVKPNDPGIMELIFDELDKK